MIQQRQLPVQLAVPKILTNKHKNPDSLIDMSGLIFKPMPLYWSQEATYRDSVVVSMDTLPLSSLPHLLPALPASPEGSKLLTLTHSTSQRSKAFSIIFGEAPLYTLAAGVVFVVYMLVPLMTTLIPVLPDIWSRTLIALEILGIIELIICRILMKTGQSDARHTHLAHRYQEPVSFFTFDRRIKVKQYASLERQKVSC